VTAAASSSFPPPDTGGLGTLPVSHPDIPSAIQKDLPFLIFPDNRRAEGCYNSPTPRPGGHVMPENWVSWLFIIAGGILIVAEIMLGAATGFDLALVGVSLATGGGLGLLFDSTLIGLFSAGALAFLYLAFLRSRIRSKLAAPNLPSNVDALIGKRAIVTARITPDSAGQVRAGDEIWRAVLSASVSNPLEPGQSATIESVNGVTLIVR
jgi:membrane protein implicated in regulation of membrane protease activity